MADFCKACSDKLYGPDMPPDLGGITKEPEWLQGKAVAVLCEGCGPIQVDPEGNCVSQDCLCAGEPGHGLPWHLEPSKIDFCGTPTGRLQTTEPQPIEPRTKHQLATMPRLGEFDASGLEERVAALLEQGSDAGTQSIYIDQIPLSQEDIQSIGMAMVARGGQMMFSAGRSERDSIRADIPPLYPPFKEFEVTGRPIEELVVVPEYQFDLVSGEGLDAKYTTANWPGIIGVVSVVKGGPGVVMEVSVGREVPPIFVKTITELLKQAIKGVETSAGLEAWAEFKRFHGNAVVYDPVDRELEVSAECLRVVYSFMRVTQPGVEVVGLVQGYAFDGPTVKVFGKLKEEADPDARIDLKGD